MSVWLTYSNNLTPMVVVESTGVPSSGGGRGGQGRRYGAARQSMCLKRSTGDGRDEKCFEVHRAGVHPYLISTFLQHQYPVPLQAFSVLARSIVTPEGDSQGIHSTASVLGMYVQRKGIPCAYCITLLASKPTNMIVHHAVSCCQGRKRRHLAAIPADISEFLTR